MNLIPVPSLAGFRFSSLVPKDAVLTSSQKAALELLECFDGVFAEMPLEFRDFLLRFFKSSGIPLDYEELPFWAHKAARHVFTICYPTLRKSDMKHPATEDFGRIAGHLWAIIRHAKERTAIFEKFPGPTVEALRGFLLRIEVPVAVLIQDGIAQPPHESKKFMAGMAHAYERTFDVTGMRKGGIQVAGFILASASLGVCLLLKLCRSRSFTHG